MRLMVLAAGSVFIGWAVAKNTRRDRLRIFWTHSQKISLTCHYSKSFAVNHNDRCCSCVSSTGS